METEVMLNRFL